MENALAQPRLNTLLLAVYTRGNKMVGFKIVFGVLFFSVITLTAASAIKTDRAGFGYSKSGDAHSHYQLCHDSQGRLINGGGPCDPQKAKKKRK
jgi:hypothetical protein